MFANESSAMGNWNRRQKWLEDLIKPSWSAVYEPRWVKAYAPPHVTVFPKNVRETALSSYSKNTIAQMSGVSPSSRTLASGLSRSIVDSIGIKKLNESIVRSVLGSTAFPHSTAWAVKSAFSDLADSQRGIFDHITEVMPKLQPFVLNSFNKEKLDSWARLGEQALEDYPGEALQDEIPPNLDELEPDDFSVAVGTIYKEIQELRKQLDNWGRTDDDFAEVEVVYEAVALQAPSSDRNSDVPEPLTRSDWIAIFTSFFGALVAITLYLAQQSQGTNEPPRIEAPTIKVSSDGANSASDAFAAGVDPADDESKAPE